MKILILQLARLGDIYMTWPFVRALRRHHPEAEIKMLVRHRFESATHGLEELDEVLVLPNRNILEPLIQERFDLEASCCRLERFLDEMENENFDAIINLSFSPLSSYLVSYLTKPNTAVYGYNRHQDGYLNFADEVSAYFYAQVGPQRYNRSHVSDLFAAMMGFNLVESDWRAPQIHSTRTIEGKYLVLHVGASESHKRLQHEELASLIKDLHLNLQDYRFVLIGAKNEIEVADYILQQLPSPRLVNLVGETSVEELFPLIGNSEMLIGCDSAPIHIASLTNTMTYNLSLGDVNFWETGPKAGVAFIKRLTAAQESRDIGIVASEVQMILNGKVPPTLIFRSQGLESYCIPNEDPQDQFAWRLIQAMYLGGEYPLLDNLNVYQGMQQISEINRILLNQYQAMTELNAAQSNVIVNQCDELLQNISRALPALSPIVNWFLTEKVRIPPASFAEMKEQTIKIHNNLKVMLSHYIPQDEVANEQV
ncbi:MAG: glycosyltransferase family 9 protein [Bdellovibrionia bacterium]